MRVKLSENFRAVFYAPFYATHALGFYTGEGVAVDFLSSEAPAAATASLLDGSIDLSRAALEWDFASGDRVFGGPPTAVLVEALLRRGADTDLAEAQAAIDRLATVPTEPGFVLHDIFLLRLRALLARTRGDEAAYRDFRDRYRDMAKTLGFEGHIAWAEAMP